MSDPHYQRAAVGDLIVVVTSHTKHTQSTGQRLWLECEVAEVTAAGEHGRVKSLRFAISGAERRRKYLGDLVALVPYPANKISVPLAMRAARDHGKPFASLEEVRALVRPFVLTDLAACGYSPTLGEAIAYVEAARDVDPDGSRGPAAADYYAAEAADDAEGDAPFASLSGEQANGNVCRVCVGEFRPGEASEPSGYIIGGGQLFAHSACVESEAV